MTKKTYIFIKPLNEPGYLVVENNYYCILINSELPKAKRTEVKNRFLNLIAERNG